MVVDRRSSLRIVCLCLNRRRVNGRGPQEIFGVELKRHSRVSYPRHDGGRCSVDVPKCGRMIDDERGI